MAVGIGGTGVTVGGNEVAVAVAVAVGGMLAGVGVAVGVAVAVGVGGSVTLGWLASARMAACVATSAARVCVASSASRVRVGAARSADGAGGALEHAAKRATRQQSRARRIGVPQVDCSVEAIVAGGGDWYEAAGRCRYGQPRDLSVPSVAIAEHETYAARRETDHDDLVLAPAPACWGARSKVDNTVRMNSYIGKRGIPPYGNGVSPYGPRSGRR